jgi:8-oxo-dGTP pyrophosphatase MutT (NUDIX family)
VTVPAALSHLVGTRRLPAGFADRAREYLSGEVAPAKPRDAATVVLLRDGGGGLEAYCLRRQRTMAFAPGMYVFPGGSVDPRDAETDTYGWVGPPPSAWAAALTASEPLARALVCAAVRETFEESGVLLAGADADTVVADTSGDDWEADRRALISRDLAFGEFLTRRGLVLRADLLRAWTHWITPEVEPRRFDTRFFVAALPTGQVTRELHEEADKVEWVGAAAAVGRWAAGTMAMMPPTLITIAEMSTHASVAGVLSAASGRAISPIMPLVVVDGDVAELVLPGDPGFGS